MFDLKKAGYRDPILVAATDGVGTKLEVAINMGMHSTVGIDLVAMCVNDLVVQGAAPLFFLDYFATGFLEPAVATSVVFGVAEGCRQAGCALIGGETAEMPGMYGRGSYDLAGFAVGAAERGALLPSEGVAEGDIIFGLASSGLHSNGFSLVRKVLEHVDLSFNCEAPFKPGLSVGEALLNPTRIYVGSCLAALRTGGVKAFAHITGGGLVENIPRVLPEGLAAGVDAGAWAVPDVFRWLAQAGDIAPMEMERTFNCGIGMVAVVAPEKAEMVSLAMKEAGETVHAIGRLIERDAGKPQVIFKELEKAWRL